MLTYTSDESEEEVDADYAETSDAELFPSAKAEVWMN